MEYRNNCDQGVADDEEKTEPVTDSEMSTPDASFLKLSDSTKLMSAVKNKEQCCSDTDNEPIPVQKNEENVDRLIHGDLSQRKSNAVTKDKSPSSSPTKTHQDPDTKELLNNVMIAANADFSRDDSDYSSSSDTEETLLKKPLKQLTCSPSSTDENKFRNDEKNTIPDLPVLINEHSLRQLNQALPDLERPKIKWFDPRNMPDESLTNKPAIWKFPNLLDLSSLSSESKTNVGSGENAYNCLPDDEFMEADRYIGDKGKQPVSKRYAYKKMSKSTVKRLTADTKSSTNNIMECDIKTVHQSCSSNEVPTKASENERTGSDPNQKSSESRFIPEEFKKAEIRWDFHDYAQKLEPSVTTELNMPTDINSNNNIYLFRIENYFDYQVSDEDVNLQEGLLMSLQSINTSQNDDDSDVDVIN